MYTLPTQFDDHAYKRHLLAKIRLMSYIEKTSEKQKASYARDILAKLLNEFDKMT